ncbi:MAG: MotA/TolQ/ExbB proton channel family protein [Gammaproteobacteria bacterium]|nr:MotA/TolQ/ExbB proton channel family protein [Gammaproteobacteria bacterium]
MDLFNGMVQFLQDGGFFMAPIGLLFIVGFVIALERWLFLGGIDSSNRRALQDITHAISVADTAKIQQAAKHQEAPVLAMLSQGIGRMAGVHRRDDLEYAMEEVILEYSLRLQKRTPMLATLANIATLLGLLGTIMGLITAFAAVANADPAEKASLLSSSISVAMNTTALGLMTAIPLVFVHSLLQGRTAGIIDTMEMAGMKLMNALAQKQSGGRDDQKA